jgi:hypothetical protein
MSCITPSGSLGSVKDFVGLNILVNDPIEADSGSFGANSNTMGYSGTPSYSLNGSGISEELVLPILNTHRNGVWGYSSWKQLRIGENSITRYHRRNNIISTNMDMIEKIVTYTGSSGVTVDTVVVLDPTPKFYSEPIGNPYNHPFQITLLKRNIAQNRSSRGTGIQNDSPVTVSFEPLIYKFSYNNDIQFFANEKLNYYTKQKLPFNYNIMKMLYLNGAIGRSPYQFYSSKYTHTIFPREENAYFDHIRQRINFSSGYWKDTRTERTIEGSDGHSIETEHKSMWPLDVSEEWQTRTGAMLSKHGKNNVDSTNSFGILWNNYSFADDTTSRATFPGNIMRPAPYYSRRHTLISSQSVANPSGRTDMIDSSNLSSNDKFSGEAYWDMPTLSGRKPFHDKSSDFSDDVKRKYKEYSIVPEFKISDHIDYYRDYGPSDENRYSLFEITGGLEGSSVSNEPDFYNNYSTTEFLKNFELLKSEHQGFADPNRITLRCKAVKKLLPYEGFYPVQRTVQLSELFYDSYYTNYNKNSFNSTTNKFSFQNLIQPLFAPGVLYNTIKSGVACDFMTFLQNTSSLGTDNSSIYLSSSSLVDRVPFEAILEPDKYLTRNLQLTEPDENCRLDADGAIDKIASWDGIGKENYKLATDNFLSEVLDFYMDKKSLTKISSKPQSKFTRAQSGKTYGMRVRMFKSMDSQRGKITSGSFEYSPPQDIGSSRETITMYSRPSAFGPPQSTGSVSPKSEFGDFGGSNGYNLCYTPPYYHGIGWADIYFTATENKRYTIQEIFSNSTVEYYRVHDHSSSSPTTYDPATINNFAMQISASVNLFGKGEVLFDTNSAPIDLPNRNNTSEDNSVWTIQTKFETPILNFNNVQTSSLTMPATAPSTVPIGMWHQSGSIPTGQEGIYLQITEIPVEWKAVKNPQTNYSDTFNEAVATGSLNDMVGFKTNKVKLGQIASTKEISEAVVAVPYYDENGVRNFYRLDPELVEVAKRGAPESNSIKKTLNALEKYVFPPAFDFVNFPEFVDPISMYVFEFTHKFNRTDLSLMWQNVMPDISINHEEQESSVSHAMLANELRIGRDGEKIDSKVRWLVFKVKQRASSDYFDRIVTKTGNAVSLKEARGVGSGLTLDEIVSPTTPKDKIKYNWPYDFFSLVELIKLDASIEFCDIDQETGGIVPITGD